MDPNDPRSHGGESHNGPAAEEEPANAEQESSQFQIPGIVNSSGELQLFSRSQIQLF